MSDKKITWVSAGRLQEEATERLIEEFKVSQPKPRNRPMGFDGGKRKAIKLTR